ncbi:MAG: hypothetical protein U0P45_03545 [Acidimicrobiales bacterium]
MASKATSNIAYPDTSATYWVTPFHLAEGQSLAVEGRFPDARYASFITYDVAGDAQSVLTDVDLEPVGGKGNPFATDVAPGGRYASPIEAAGDRSVIYRVYLGRPDGDPTAGWPSPPWWSATPTVRPRPWRRAPTRPRARAPGRSSRSTARPRTRRRRRPRSSSAAGDGANLYPNPDNTYVAADPPPRARSGGGGQGTTPTFPDTGAGQPVAGDHQVRYWSMCTNEYRKPYPVTACVPDQDVALAADGTYTFVISTLQDRPSNATAAEGVTWLRWGATDVDVLLLLRQMLPAEGFAAAAANVAPGGLASTVMGPYAPLGTICTTAQFEAGDAACG